MSPTLSCKLVEVSAMINAVLLQNQAKIPLYFIIKSCFFSRTRWISSLWWPFAMAALRCTADYSRLWLAFFPELNHIPSWVSQNGICNESGCCLLHVFSCLQAVVPEQWKELWSTGANVVRADLKEAVYCCIIFCSTSTTLSIYCLLFRKFINCFWEVFSIKVEVCEGWSSA